MEVEFVEELSDFFRCPICRHCLDDPMQTPCGHRFCQQCINSVLQSSQPVCPLDRTGLDNVFPDAACRRQINALKVYCSNKNSGCTWSGEMSDEACHQKSCQYGKVACEFCSEKIPRVNMAKHKDECRKRPVTCNYCLQQMDYQNLEEHFTSCGDFPVKCPNNCSEEPLPRNKINHHVSEVCPRTKLPCQLSLFGCSELIERQQFGKHLAQCSMNHVSQLVSTVVKLQDEMKMLQTELSEQKLLTDKLKVAPVPQSTSGRFVWRLEGISDKLITQPVGMIGEEIYSEEFYSHEGGYKMCLCVYPNGGGNNQALSLYFVLMKGPYDAFLKWPFSYRVVLTLVNVHGPSSIKKIIIPDPNLPYFKRPVSCRNAGYGYPAFIAHSKLQDKGSGFVQEDCILIRTEVHYNE